MTDDKKRRRPYGEGSLYLRGRIWHVKWREVRRTPDGGTEYVQHRESTRSEDREHAQRFLRARLQEAGGRPKRETDPGDILYEDLRAAYLAESIERGLRSVRNGRIAALARLDAFFSGWRVADFDVRSLKEFRQGCRRDGLTDATANRCMAALKRMFNLAVEDERLAMADIPSHFPMTKEPNRARGAVFIEDEWYGPLRAELREPLRSAFVLCYFTGIRVHEMLRLRWRDVDARRKAVNLPGEVTKTGEPRSVPLPSDFALKAGRPDDPVFPLRDSRFEWRRACVKLGIGHYRCRECAAVCDGQACPEHGRRTLRGLSYSGPLLRHTRHTAARNMAGTGMPEARIMAVTGHVTRAMFDRYQIGREGDVEAMRVAIEKAHRERQARARE